MKLQLPTEISKERYSCVLKSRVNNLMIESCAGLYLQPVTWDGLLLHFALGRSLCCNHTEIEPRTVAVTQSPRLLLM